MVDFFVLWSGNIGLHKPPESLFAGVDAAICAAHIDSIANLCGGVEQRSVCRIGLVLIPRQRGQDVLCHLLCAEGVGYLQSATRVVAYFI